MSPPNSVNDWADYWRYNIGINVIPADTKNKIPLVKWSDYQDKPIPEEQHETWRLNNSFLKGMAIIPGKVWHNNIKRGLYFDFIDLDNKKAIEEFCRWNGVNTKLEELAKHIIIEQHLDEPNKAHAYVYSRHPFLKKSSDRISGLSSKIDRNEVPAIEVKGLGEHGIAYCTPSPHMNGHSYQIIGTLEPEELDKLDQHIDNICKKYNIPYLDGGNNGRSLKPIQDLFQADTKIYEGHNRHEALLRVMESLIRRNRNIMTEPEIKFLGAKWNRQHCVPPLSEHEFDDQWTDATNFIKKMLLRNGESESRESESEDDEDNNSTKAELVLQKTRKYCTKLFVDEYQVPHTTIDVNGHLEVLPLASKRFRNWISRMLYEEDGIVIDSQSLKDAVGILAAQAEFDNEPIKLNLRVASIEDGSKTTWYYDLTNKKWEFIEITSNGWKIVNNQVVYRRFNNQLPQVYPSREYSEDIFEKFLNLLNLKVKEENKTEEYRLLLKCYIICLFVPEIPKAVLMPHGHQGSAKTTLFEFIKMLTDPSIVRTLSFPRDVNELIQQLSHNHVAFYDNISELPDWISDQICRAVTGSGSSRRVLYTDDDDFIRNLKRCIGLNGINLAATKADLLDRGLTFQLTRIDEQNRRKIKDLEKEFELIRPQLLGYILDILVKVLKWKEEQRELNLTKLPRMADFAECCEIISRCMGNPDNAFLDAYNENIKLQVQELIEASQVATCVIQLITPDDDSKDKKPIEWTGTATALLSGLEEIALEIKINVKGKYWPKAPNQLSRRLNEIASVLKDAGIEVEWTRSDRGKARTITIHRVPSSPSSSSSDQNQARNSQPNVDDTSPANKTSSSTSSSKNDQNRAQSEVNDDAYDDDDVFRELKGRRQ